MAAEEKDEKKKIFNINTNDPEKEGGGEEGGESGEGGKSGSIEFHDFLSTGENIRDDMLSRDEIRRLLSTHKDSNELRVKSQKDKRDDYKKLKEGKMALQVFRETHGIGAGRSAFRANPALRDKAQFSGVDRQVNALPTENMADTNQEKKDELLNELRHRLGYAATPKFNPKPQGPGYS